MNKKKLASFRLKLNAIRADLIGDVEGNFQSSQKDVNEHMADLVDEAAQSYSRQLMLSLGEQELKRLQLVESALERMDQDQYGHCSECEKPIPVARLEVVPFTEHCVGCLHSIEEEEQPSQHR